MKLLRFITITLIFGMMTGCNYLNVRDKTLIEIKDYVNSELSENAEYLGEEHRDNGYGERKTLYHFRDNEYGFEFYYETGTELIKTEEYEYWDIIDNVTFSEEYFNKFLDLYGTNTAKTNLSFLQLI